MSLYTNIGYITRALPNEEGTEIKLQTVTGSILLDVPMNRPELRDLASHARFNKIEMTVRHTEDGMVVDMNPYSNLMVA